MKREHCEINCMVSADYYRGNSRGMTYEHNHTHYEISIIVSGRFEISNNGDRIKTDAPCVVFHFPGTYHSIVTDPDIVYERYNINYTAEVFRNYAALLSDTEQLFAANASVVRIDSDTLDELLYYVRPLLRARFDTDKQTALLGVVLNILKSCQPVSGFAHGKPSGSYINGIVRYISDNLSPIMPAEQIAAEFFISRAKLAADFKRETGMTLKQYIDLLCVERAKLALAEGKSVQTTAVELGYTNVGSFIRSFKKLTGVTPGGYMQERAIIT